MSGGLYIKNYSEELTEFYKPGKEVITFRSKYELIEKIKYYLNHPDYAIKLEKLGMKEQSIVIHTKRDLKIYL